MTQPPIVPGPPPQPVYFPPAPKKGLSGGRIALIVAACAGIPLLLCVGAVVFINVIGNSPSTGASSGPRANAAIDDAKLTSCDTKYGIATAGVRVTNSTSRKARYTVTVRFTNGSGDKLGTGSTYLGEIDPGQSAVDEVSTFVASGETAGRCQVESVIRL